MALRQLMALRLGSQAEQGCSRLVANAAMFSSSAAPAAAESAMQGVAAAELKAVQQFTASEAAALAAKKHYINGLGGVSLKPSSFMGTFASGKAFSSAAVAAAEPTKQKANSFFSKAAKAAAALIGAFALAMGSGASADAPSEWQWNFQDSATSTAQAMQDLHHDVMFFVWTVGAFVLYMTGMIVTKFHYAKAGPIAEKITHHTTLEVLWTIFPTLVVLLIGIPSLTLIYSMDQSVERPGLTVKIIGRQWYWSYEMHDHLQHKLVDPDRLVAIAEKSLRA